MTNARIEFEVIKAENFNDLKSLVIEQATHHASKYVGDDAAFVAALGRDNPVTLTLVARNDDTGEPLGYILFNNTFGFKGQEYYIEDILVSATQRSQGYGLKMIEELKAKGAEVGIDGISWSVSRNNEGAVRFYEKKVHAHPLSAVTFDCDHLFKKGLITPPGYEVRKVDAADLDLVESYVDRLPNMTGKKAQDIRAAAAAANADVYIALSDDGTPKALAITNSHFSTFRTVYGYKLEMMELDVTGTDDATDAFECLAAHVLDVGKATGHTGHLNFYCDINSIPQREFARRAGGQPAQMTSDPASLFDLYGIGRDIIYAPKSQNVVNNNPSAPEPPAL